MCVVCFKNVFIFAVRTSGRWAQERHPVTQSRWTLRCRSCAPPWSNAAVDRSSRASRYRRELRRGTSKTGAISYVSRRERFPALSATHVPARHTQISWGIHVKIQAVRSYYNVFNTELNWIVVNEIHLWYLKNKYNFWSLWPDSLRKMGRTHLGILTKKTQQKHFPDFPTP